MPVNWVDGVTPVNAANLETMEADTAAKQALTEKAAANGYAPLDGTAKVPLVHLPPVSGVDYIGTWGSGIAYKRGDVVRYGSNDYLAVNDSTGVAPPAAYNVPLGGVSIGTSLPASPYDGQEFVLTDSLTAPSYTWRFRFNAGSSSAYKWEFVGGASATAYVSASQTFAGTDSWVDTATVGPSFVVPCSGEYNVAASENTYLSVGGTSGMWMGITIGAGTPVDPYISVGDVTQNGSGIALVITPLGPFVAAAGNEIRVRYRAAGTPFVSRRRLSVEPRRVA